MRSDEPDRRGGVRGALVILLEGAVIGGMLCGLAFLGSLILGAAAPDASARAVPESTRGEASTDRFSFERPAMGTRFRIVVHAPDSQAAGKAAEAAFALVERMDSLLSDYRTDSEIARVAEAAGERVRVSPELASILAVAQGWSRRTRGAFDVTVGPLTRLWRWSARRGELPESARLETARSRVGYEELDVDPELGTVRLARPGMALDLGGIAKGWAADAALRELRARGLESALVDAGGDLLLGAAPPGRRGWTVSIPGGEVLVLTDVAVATSGDAERWLEVEGVRYSHIVDPRTGLGVPEAPTVTVVAPTATVADVLASALTVLGPEEGRALLRAEPGASARILGSVQWTSPGFPDPVRPTPPEQHLPDSDRP